MAAGRISIKQTNPNSFGFIAKLAKAIAGGAANEVLYQLGSGSTGFVATPTGFGVLAQTGTGAPSMQNLGVQFTVASSQPSSPNNGDRWFNSATGIGYVWLSSQSAWVNVVGM